MRKKLLELLFEGAQLEQELAKPRQEKLYPLSRYFTKLTQEHRILPPVRLAELHAVAKKKRGRLVAVPGGFNFEPNKEY